ncbi:hypothetical protein GW17_00047638, partial [Ensete ventricosum]
VIRRRGTPRTHTRLPGTLPRPTRSRGIRPRTPSHRRRRSSSKGLPSSKDGNSLDRNPLRLLPQPPHPSLLLPEHRYHPPLAGARHPPPGVDLFLESGSSEENPNPLVDMCLAAAGV